MGQCQKPEHLIADIEMQVTRIAKAAIAEVEKATLLPLHRAYIYMRVSSALMEGSRFEMVNEAHSEEIYPDIPPL